VDIWYDVEVSGGSAKRDLVHMWYLCGIPQGCGGSGY
jgi:hypothetical protein